MRPYSELNYSRDKHIHTERTYTDLIVAFILAAQIPIPIGYDELFKSRILVQDSLLMFRFY